MASNGLKGLARAGNGWNRWKWLEMTGNCWKLLKWLIGLEMFGMSENDWKCMGWLGKAGND